MFGPLCICCGQALLPPCGKHRDETEALCKVDIQHKERLLSGREWHGTSTFVCCIAEAPGANGAWQDIRDATRRAPVQEVVASQPAPPSPAQGQPTNALAHSPTHARPLQCSLGFLGATPWCVVRGVPSLSAYGFLASSPTG